MYVLILILSFVAVWYWYQKRIFRKWKDLGVPGPEPIFPFGNVMPFVTLKSSLSTVYADIYNKYKHCRYVGIFLMSRPALLIRDPDMIEEILVRKFSNFHDNDIHVNKEDDPIFGENPFVAKGDEWKKIRTQHLLNLTGAKVKNMFEAIDKVGDKMVEFLQNKTGNDGKFCMDALEIMARYTTDSVTSCTLDTDGKSFGDEEPRLRNAGKTIFEPNKLTGIKVIALFTMPWLSKIISLKLISKSLNKIYTKMVLNVLKRREVNGLVKNDFFDNIRRRMNLKGMVAQVGGAFIDGFGTNSSALNFMLYEIAENTKVQEKLRKEVKTYLDSCNGKISFEGVQGLEYLDAVVHESLRKYPPFPQLTKICTEETLMSKSTDSSPEIKMEVGLPVVIPVYACHNDEDFFPEPNKFEPERFLPENREKMVKYTYMPFGDGPRVCIGRKFALLQSKMALFKLTANFDMSIDYKKTKTPVELDPFGLILAAKGRIWINFVKI